MKPRSARSIAILFILIFFLVSLSKPSPDKLRGATASFFGPLWENISQISWKVHLGDSNDQEIQQLRLENHRLHTELASLQEQVKQQIDLKRHCNIDAMAARVIFRSPAYWNSSLWIDVGQDHNKDRVIVAKNSPVLVGTSIVGVIEYVGHRQSRVRLITDSALTPSVRATRKDSSQNIVYLAKGELQGSGKPLWRASGTLLQGIGFNYDFADKEGPARDLHTGKSLDPLRKVPEMAILAVGDLLVTTGMDGVFPPGFQVATVTKIKPLGEGDYFYELEAIPTAGPMDDLSLVLVIPPTNDSIEGFSHD